MSVLPSYLFAAQPSLRFQAVRQSSDQVGTIARCLGIPVKVLRKMRISDLVGLLEERTKTQANQGESLKSSKMAALGMIKMALQALASAHADLLHAKAGPILDQPCDALSAILQPIRY